MPNSFNYIARTNKRCVVGVFLDTANTSLTFGITASAFGYSVAEGSGITNNTASLSRIVYGMSGPQGGANSVSMRFGTTQPIVPNPVFVIGGWGANAVDFERLTLHNNALTADGTFIVQNGTAGVVTAYLEFVPF
jgi:hypothetical protein